MRKQAFVVMILVVAAGCSSGLKRPMREVTATVDTDQVQRVTVRTHSYWFDPNRIVVKRGIPVELTVKNGALLVPHDFSCTAGEAGVDVDARVRMFMGSNHVRFTPTKAGTYEFQCDVDGHAHKGMRGTLVVVE